MNDLLNFAVEAHGGLKRWSRVTTVTAAASITGETWKVKGKRDYPKNVIFAVDTQRERVTMDFPGQDKRSVFEPNRVEIQRRDGTVVATRDKTGGRTMVREPFLRVRFLLIAMLALVATGAAAAHPNATSNIILVHGAWADGSSWSRVIPLLEARGFNVTAVQLPLTSLADDVATTRRAIAHVVGRHPGPVVLVGHSYGGVVIGEAGNDPNVVGLVYVAAFVPDQGQSVLSLLSGSPTPTPLGSHLVVDNGFFTIDPTGVEQDFAQCLPEVERDVLTVTQGPTSGAALTDAAISPAWKTKPSWFIVAKRDRTIPPDLEETMAATIGARTTTLNTCHLAMLDLPSKVAAVIADAAGGQ